MPRSNFNSGPNGSASPTFRFGDKRDPSTAYPRTSIAPGSPQLSAPGIASAPYIPTAEETHQDVMNRWNQSNEDMGQGRAYHNAQRNGVIDAPMAPTVIIGSGRAPAVVPGNANIVSPAWAPGISRAPGTPSPDRAAKAYQILIDGGMTPEEARQHAFGTATAQAPGIAPPYPNSPAAHPFVAAPSIAPGMNGSPSMSWQAPTAPQMTPNVSATPGAQPGMMPIAPSISSRSASNHSAPGLSAPVGSAAEGGQNPVQFTDQQARSMWDNIVKRLGQTDQARSEFHQTLSKYGVNGNHLLDTWAAGGTLGAQHFDVTPGIHMPLSLVGSNNGMDAAQNGRLGYLAPHRAPMINEGTTGHQAVPGPSIQTPATLTPSPFPGSAPLARTAGTAAPPPNRPPDAAPAFSTPTISSRDQYEALPSGASYVDGRSGARKVKR